MLGATTTCTSHQRKPSAFLFDPQIQISPNSLLGIHVVLSIKTLCQYVTKVLIDYLHNYCHFSNVRHTSTRPCPCQAYWPRILWEPPRSISNVLNPDIFRRRYTVRILFEISLVSLSCSLSTHTHFQNPKIVNRIPRRMLHSGPSSEPEKGRDIGWYTGLLPKPRSKFGSSLNRYPAVYPMKGRLRSYSMILASTDPPSSPPSSNTGSPQPPLPPSPPFFPSPPPPSLSPATLCLA